MGTRCFWASVVLAGAAGGCAVGPNYRTPETSAPATWSSLEPRATASQPTSAPTTQPADVVT